MRYCTYYSIKHIALHLTLHNYREIPTYIHIIPYINEGSTSRQRKLSYDIVNDVQNKAGNVIKGGRANGKQWVTPPPPTPPSPHPGKKVRCPNLRPCSSKLLIKYRRLNKHTLTIIKIFSKLFL
jgi:DNA-directed RNA polymerase subunit RPC12/RpoP